MALSYEAAVSELYRAPIERFVEERKRLAAELKTTGDPSGAARLGKLPRPTVSVWSVNQLWWRERDAFEALFETAERLRQGESAAGAEHRQVLAALRKHAATLLSEAGHGVADATLRRVTATLSALAVAGGFEPDQPGALGADREAPGFAATGTMTFAEAPQETPRAEPASAREERRREEEERKRRLAEQRRLEAEIKTARLELDAREREVKRLRDELEQAERGAGEARVAVSKLESELDPLDEPRARRH